MTAKKRFLSEPMEFEEIVSFNCRVEIGPPIKVTLLGYDADKKQYYNAFDATKEVPCDEAAILEIKGKHFKQDYFSQLRRRK